VYQVEIWIELRDGSFEHTQVSYTIDSSAEDIVVHTSEVPGGLVVRVLTGEEPREVRASFRDLPGLRAVLQPSPRMGCSAAFLPASAGRHQLRLVVTDRARNEHVEELDVTLLGREREASFVGEDAALGACP
jgi:hypothetical protein